MNKDPGYVLADYYDRAVEAIAAMIETNMAVHKKGRLLEHRAMISSSEFHDKAMDMAGAMMWENLREGGDG